MADLEDLGYIFQPHTSAGRIPSDKGYRLYVDMLMEEKNKRLQKEKARCWRKPIRLRSITAGSKSFGDEYELCDDGIVSD